MGHINLSVIVSQQMNLSVHLNPLSPSGGYKQEFPQALEYRN